MKALLDNRRDMVRELARLFDVRLTGDTLVRLTEMFTPAKFRYRTVIHTPDSIASRISFIQRGLLRVYTSSPDGDVVEKILHEGHLLIIEESLFHQQPSHCYVQTLEPTILYSFDYQELVGEAQHDPAVSELLLAILQENTLSYVRSHSLFNDNPRERYVKLLEADSEIVRRTPLKYVASYLHMAPETLSRVRKALQTESD